MSLVSGSLPSLSRSFLSRVKGAALLVTLIGSAAACNAITGAGDLEVQKGIGAIGADDDTTTTGSGAGSSGDTSSTGSGETTTGVTSSAASGVQCVWPETGFGVKQGNFVKPGMTWQGFTKGSSEISDIAVEDFFDCDGSKGINAVMFIQSATWCGNCQAEAQGIPSKMSSSWAEKGIQVVTLMIEDITGKAATTDTALEWLNEFNLVDTTVAADPNFSFAFAGTIGLPYILVVDPRTMEIVHVQEGYSGQHKELENLADQNAL